MTTLYISGKFLRQRTTGVQRFARGLVQALDEELMRARTADRVVLLKPPAAQEIALRFIEQRTCGTSIRSLNLWEQTALPWAARDGTLLCLSGSAPLLGGRRVPTIHDAALYLHGQAYSRPFAAWYHLLFATVTRRAPLLLTVSSNSAKELAEHLPGRRFQVVYNAAEHILGVKPEPGIVASLGLDRQRYLLAVASFNPTKNLSGLIRAYARLPASTRPPLIIVGAANPAVFSGTSIQTDVPADVVFAGAVSDGELRALYEHALAFVFPSLYEGFGIPPLEAMHCGCPVIASHASAIPEVCADAALYFDGSSTEDMALTLERIIADADLRTALIARGVQRSAQFSWRCSAASLRDHLRGIGLLAEQTATF